MERVSYQKPRRLNAVSGTLIALALLFGYWMWRFFPVYFDAWTVDHILIDIGAQVYNANRLGEPARTDTLRDLLEKAKLDMRKKADVTDPDLSVSMNIDGDNCVLTADYIVKVTHPLVASQTVMHMHREEKADVKRVDWDKQR
jgi:hypothetical protein